MARRSPMNERYQKNTSPAGKTRRSASAAKPKRAATGSSSKAVKGAPKRGARQPLIVNPPTEEFRRWRKIWWFLLGGSLLMTMGSMGVRQWTGMIQLATAMLTIGYMMIFAALYIDWSVLRRMRREWLETGGKSGGKSTSSAEADSDTSGEKGSE